MKALFLVLTLALAGCGTVVPEPTPMPSVISWDQNEQNGGIIRLLPQGGAEITTRALMRYEALLEKYRDKFLPPLERRYGVTTVSGAIFLNADALEKFIVMNQWHRMGRQ